MLSKMAQPNNVGGGGGGGGSGPAAGGRRMPLSLSGAGASGGSTVSRLQQSGSNGRSNSPQNSNQTSKKNESTNAAAGGPFVSLKKSSIPQRSSSSTSASSTSSSNVSKDEKKSQNGVSSSKSANGNEKAAAQNGSSGGANVKEQQKHKEKVTEKKEAATAAKKEEAAKPSKSEATKAATAVEKIPEAVPIEIVDLVDKEEEVVAAAVSTTPTSERKSTRKASQQKSPVQKKEEKPTADAVVAEDVEMEPLTVDASPIRSVVSAVAQQPTATSTPGRNLFGTRKQTNEVELAAQPSSSPAVTPARNFSQISGRRSIRPTVPLTPGTLGSYRCINTSELDTSNCTNASMNATVGSEIPNSSSFSFSFFGRGRKRERTPPPLTGSQSTNNLAQDVEMSSPPKRARFDLFSLNLASPFSMLRSRFSKTTISSPSTRQRPTAGDDEEEIGGDGGGVQNVSGIIIQEDEEPQQEQGELNKSSATDEITVAQEAGLEESKKSGGSPGKNVGELADSKKSDVQDQDDEAVANLPANADVEAGEVANRSRCAIM